MTRRDRQCHQEEKIHVDGKGVCLKREKSQPSDHLDPCKRKAESEQAVWLQTSRDVKG